MNVLLGSAAATTTASPGLLVVVHDGDIGGFVGLFVCCVFCFSSDFVAGLLGE